MFKEALQNFNWNKMQTRLSWNDKKQRPIKVDIYGLEFEARKRLKLTPPIWRNSGEKQKLWIVSDWVISWNILYPRKKDYDVKMKDSDEWMTKVPAQKGAKHNIESEKLKSRWEYD